MKRPNIIRCQVNGAWYSWDLEKEWETVQARQIPFAEACTIFSDPYHLELEMQYENNEPRHRIIGFSSQRRRLIVLSYDYLFADEVHQTRIVTAFFPEQHEVDRYLQQENRPPVNVV